MKFDPHPVKFLLCVLISLVLLLLALYLSRERNFVNNCMDATTVLNGARNTREFCEGLRRQQP